MPSPNTSFEPLLQGGASESDTDVGVAQSGLGATDDVNAAMESKADQESKVSSSEQHETETAAPDSNADNESATAITEPSEVRTAIAFDIVIPDSQFHRVFSNAEESGHLHHEHRQTRQSHVRQ